MRPLFGRGNAASNLNRHQLLFVLIIIIGVFARVWEFPSLPPNLDQDEASTAVDAFSLYAYGVDRNGIPFPVALVAWGSGMSALYAYILIPLIAMGGLTPFVVRLPMLLFGLISLPIMYAVARRTAGQRYGLIAMFLLAISPWHVMASRFGFEAHLLPFVFLVSFALLLKSSRENHWFIPAAAMFALSLYSYAPALAAVPLFLAGAIPVLLYTGRVKPRTLLLGLLVFAIIAAPMGLFILVNTRDLETIRLGFLTIPRLPSQPRFESQAALFNESVLQSLKLNARQLASLLWHQTDHLPRNVVDPYGYFYTYTLPVAVVGGLLVIPFRKLRSSPERLLVLCWLVAASCLGLLQSANINRINLIFIPLLLCTAMSLEWLARRSKGILTLVICSLLVGFALFTRDYHGDRYWKLAGGPFYDGLLPALEFARQVGDNPICVTDEVYMPYIYVLFIEKMDPAGYLATINYLDPRSENRLVRRLGRYRFGQRNCTNHSDGTVYVLDVPEPLPFAELYRSWDFSNYRVYVP